MANKYLTMLDLAKRQGASSVVGLIEDNKDAAPEFAMVPTRTINGTTYKTNIRKSLPAVAFRNVNEGVETTKSEYAQDIVQAFVIDSQLEVDKALVEADEEGQGAGAILADEASGVMRALMLYMGSQFYYGTSNDSKGFQGLENFVDSSQILNAAGTTASTAASLYAVRMGGKEGVNFVAGKKSSLRLGKWKEQQITRDSKKLTGLVNNLQGWVGLAFGHYRSVGRIYNLTEDAGKGLTDTLIADLLAKFPLGLKPSHLFANQRSIRQLQQSRTANGQATYRSGAEAPFPTEAYGIPLVPTDSLVSTEDIV